MHTSRDATYDLEAAKELLLPPRDKIISILRYFGLHEEKVKHSVDVADLALKVAKEVQKDGIAVDERIVEAGALLHDIGLTRTLDDFSPQHSVIGADIIRKLGLPERVARCTEVHEGGGGLTRVEAEELKFPILPLKDSYAPTTVEEKIVTVADLGIHIPKEAPEAFGYETYNPWKHPEQLMDVEFPYFRDVYKKKLNKTITKDHPILKRLYNVNKDMLKYVKRDL